MRIRIVGLRFADYPCVKWREKKRGWDYSDCIQGVPQSSIRYFNGVIEIKNLDMNKLIVSEFN